MKIKELRTFLHHVPLLVTCNSALGTTECQLNALSVSIIVLSGKDNNTGVVQMYVGYDGTIQGDHLSGKPGNVREFDSC